MADDEFTQDLFRFLQLLCEGHNNGEEDSGQGVEDTEVPGFQKSPELTSNPPPPLPRDDFPSHAGLVQLWTLYPPLLEEEVCEDQGFKVTLVTWLA